MRVVFSSFLCGVWVFFRRRSTDSARDLIFMNGFYVAKASHTGRMSALLAIAHVDPLTGEGRGFRIFRPATGEHTMSRSVLENKYKRVAENKIAPYWKDDFARSEHQCNHTQQPCAYGPTCEVGKRVRVVHVLSGSLLAIWGRLEAFIRETSRHKKATVKVVRVVESGPQQGQGQGGPLPPTGRQILGISIANVLVPQLKELFSRLSAQHLRE
jgi:hypothetical protein